MAADRLQTRDRPRVVTVYGADYEVAHWVGEQLGIKSWGPCSAIGIAEGGRLIAGVVYNNYHWPSIELSIASISPRWASRRTLREIFRYPFVQLGCKRVNAITPLSNTKALKMNERLGLKVECKLKDAVPDGDAALVGLHINDCRWL
jgi:RimJ/RimL family protein N-acetyltransferase